MCSALLYHTISFIYLPNTDFSLYSLLQKGHEMTLGSQTAFFSPVILCAGSPRVIGCTVQIDSFSFRCVFCLHQSKQCNNLIDHFTIIGITRILTLQSMLAMLQSPLTLPPSPPRLSILGCSAPLSFLHLPCLLSTVGAGGAAQPVLV